MHPNIITPPNILLRSVWPGIWPETVDLAQFCHLHLHANGAKLTDILSHSKFVYLGSTKRDNALRLAAALLGLPLQNSALMLAA